MSGSNNQWLGRVSEILARCFRFFIEAKVKMLSLLLIVIKEKLRKKSNFVKSAEINSIMQNFNQIGLI